MSSLLRFRRSLLAPSALVALLLSLVIAPPLAAAADPSPDARAGTYGAPSLPTTGVDLSRGAATASLGITVPSVRGGLTSAMQGLQYSSQSGTSDAGEGWSLGIPFIQRKNPSGPPFFHDPAPNAKMDPNVLDRFEASNGGSLVPICSVRFGSCPPGETMPPWASNWHYFRAEREGGFARYFWSVGSGKSVRPRSGKSGRSPEAKAPPVKDRDQPLTPDGEQGTGRDAHDAAATRDSSS